MRKPEQNLFDSMKRNAPEDALILRMENVVGDGTPDCYCAFRNGSTCWVELKVAALPARDTTSLLTESKFPAHQRAWHMRLDGYGVSTWVLVREPRYKRMWLVPGWRSEMLISAAWSEIDYAYSVGSDWGSIWMKLR